MQGFAPTSLNHVVGESYADGAFIQAVASVNGVPSFDFTTPQGSNGVPLGNSGFRDHLKALRAFIDRKQVRNIVLVADNDKDHAKNFADARKAFRDAGGYPSPSSHPLGLATAHGLKVGILMLPASGENGCLESILLKATRSSGPAAECLSTWLECSGFPKVPKNHCDKFLIRSVLAASITDDPNISLRRIWTEANNPIKQSDAAFVWIADFLKTVFE